MILHYANLCVLAGGVDLFLLGSEFRGLETCAGRPGRKAGTTGGDGKVTWDYPFVAGLMQLADDVRSVFDGAGLTKDTAGLHNLIAYSADWSDWMGFQHPGENGQWPHLDQLYAHDNIDLVSLRQLSAAFRLDDGTRRARCRKLELARADPASWPPSTSAMNGLGLAGQPTLYTMAYLQANIEGGEKFNWFYNDGTNDGIGLDPNGTDLRVSLPEGDRLTQSRNPYYPNQQLLANKQLRWWWNNPHQAIYDDGDGTGWSPHGPTPNGCRNRNRSPLSNMACRPAIAAPISRMSSTIRNRRTVSRPIGRSGILLPAALISRAATMRSSFSRCRRSMIIGS